MRRIVVSADGVLRRRSVAVSDGVVIAIVAAACYGVCMGSYSVTSPERSMQMAYAAIKTPMLLALTTALCVPGFIAVNVAAGLRGDLPTALRAVVGGQATAAIVLASLAPLTLVVYSMSPGHSLAILVNLVMFTVAAAAGQIASLRAYRPLIARRPGHRWTLACWLVLYGLVGVQLAWMFRPFVGSPGLPVRLFREDPFTNGYVVVLRLVFGA